MVQSTLSSSYVLNFRFNSDRDNIAPMFGVDAFADLAATNGLLENVILGATEPSAASDRQLGTLWVDTSNGAGSPGVPKWYDPVADAFTQGASPIWSAVRTLQADVQSEAQVDAKVLALETKLLGGAVPAYDTLLELKAYMDGLDTDNDADLASLLVTVGTKLNSADFTLANLHGNVDQSFADYKLDAALSAALAPKENSANKGAASGYAGLDGNQKLLETNIPTDLRKSLPNLVTMQAYAAVEGQFVHLAGRDGWGDGADGLFRFHDADYSAPVAADEVTPGQGDGGVIVAPASDRSGASGAFVKVFDGQINVKDYGAKGDGVTDDTAAFAAAIKRLQETSDTRLLIPDGRYVISQSLVYNQPALGNSILIEGESQIETQILFTGSGNLLDITLGTAANQISNACVIRNLSLITDSATAGAAIKTSRSASGTVSPAARFEDVYIYQTGSGVWTYGIHSIDASETWLVRCYIMLFGDDSTAGLFIDNNLSGQSVFGLFLDHCSINGAVNNVRVRGKLETVNITGGLFVGATDCLDFDATGTTSGNPHLTIYGAHINAKRFALITREWRTMMFTATDFYSGVGVGDLAGENMKIFDAEHVTVTGCKFEIGAVGLARSFIDFNNVSNFSITGNVMNNATAAGIIIQGASAKGIITANTIAGYDDGTPNNEAIYNAATGEDFTYTSNIIQNFADGILLNSSNNLVYANNFKNITNVGIRAVGGVNNLQRANAFFSVGTNTDGTFATEDVTLGVVTADAGSQIVAAKLKSNSTDRVILEVEGPSGTWQAGIAGAAAFGGLQENAFFLFQGGVGYRWWINPGGLLNCPGVYLGTTAAGANVSVDSDGLIVRSTSAAKYKVDREDITLERVDKFFEICAQEDTLVWYRSDQELTVDPEGYSFYGMIADKFQHEFPQLCNFGSPDKDGNVEVEGFDYDRTVPFLIARLLEQETKIADLMGRLSTLEKPAAKA